MPASSVCGADQLGENLHQQLGENLDTLLPSVDLTNPNLQIPGRDGNPLYAPVTRLSNAQLTEKTVNGNGTFDVLMATHKAHLREEYDKGRITGDQYAKAYIELTTTAMSSSVQYLLGRDQAYWQALVAQAQARRAEIEAVTAAIMLEKTKAELVTTRLMVKKAEGEVALTKMMLAQADADYCLKMQQKLLTEADVALKGYELTKLLPAQVALTNSQKLGQDAQNIGTGRDNEIKLYNLNNILPSQKALTDEQKAQISKQILLLHEQIAGEVVDTSIKSYTRTDILPVQRDLTAQQADGTYRDNLIKAFTLDEMMPQQKLVLVAQVAGAEAETGIKQYQLSDILPAQKIMLQEQGESQRAQTLDTRINGAPVAGAIGKQKDLYNQQIISYQQDARQKVGKLFTDAWITQKTLDEGLLAPNQFTNAELDEVLVLLRGGVSLGS